MKHKHEKIEIVSEYKNDHPTEILAVFCECGQFFLDLMGELSDRENEGFRLRDNSGVVIINPKWDYIRESKYYHPIE
jgi:hypothetical protein